MKPAALFTIIAIILALLPGCAPAGTADEALFLDETLHVQENQTVAINVNVGRITIRGNDTNQLEINGHIPFPDKTTYQISETPEQITLSAEYRNSTFFSPAATPVDLDITVPDGVVLQVDGFEVEFDIVDFDGTVDISITAGSIQADQLSGIISLQSGRGDINLVDSAGDIRVLGEHGTLTVAESSGEIDVSSIMGTIIFTGDVLADDQVHLEVDHGPVEVRLRPTSDMALVANSTSGNVDCRLPQRTFTTWGCTAELGAANGRFDIRTVSGHINIQLIP